MSLLYSILWIILYIDEREVEGDKWEFKRDEREVKRDEWEVKRNKREVKRDEREVERV